VLLKFTDVPAMVVNEFRLVINGQGYQADSNSWSQASHTNLFLILGIQDFIKAVKVVGI